MNHIQDEDENGIQLAVRRCNLKYIPPTYHNNTISTDTIDERDLIQCHLNADKKP